MDIKPISAAASEAERAVIDAAVGTIAVGDGGPHALAASRAARHLLLPALHAIQGRFGWISAGALGYACERLGVPPAEGYGVASFYALLSLKERPKTIVHVCDDIACAAAGAGALTDELTREIGAAGVAASGGAWHRSPCLGLCEQAPAAMLVAAGAEPFERAWGHATARHIKGALQHSRIEPDEPVAVPQRGAPSLRLLRRVGVVDPTSLDDYRAHGGYAALRRAFELGAPGVVREVTEAKLLGRGGAAFPTGRKWEAVARSGARPHYLVCNADESEPGTFKDRVLLEEDPFAVVEAMTIAAFAVGAEKGFVYLRGEYPLALARLEGAIQAARARGLLGDDIALGGGRGLHFDIEVRRGAGAYICGEETALFASIEGFRGEPRNKPPFPVDVGLFGKPTCVNNVETLANVLPILELGAAGYRAVGTADSAGTRLFCVSGRVARPGLYEHPFGVTLSEVIAQAGGVSAGRPLRAVLLGGAAGTFVGPADLELRMTFEDTRKAGATLGSGVVMVFDDEVDMGAVLQRIAAFFRDESCGQCVPCRVGTVRQEELVTRLVKRSRPGSIESRTGARPGSIGNLATEKALLGELGQAMRDASICGLGQTASSAIESAVAKLALFEEEP